MILGKSILCKASWLQVLLKQKSLGEVGARMAKMLQSKDDPHYLDMGYTLEEIAAWRQKKESSKTKL